MTTTTYEKALVTRLDVKGERLDFILPYEGYLIDAKVNELAKKLCVRLNQLGERGRTPAGIARHLMREWHTGREKNVTVEDCGTHVNVRGQGWAWIGHMKESVIVL